MMSAKDLERPGLSPTTFDLGDGECLVVTGPSGSGKTLLLRALADLDPSSGVVMLDGQLRDAVPGPAWRRKVAYLPAESGWWSERVGDHFADWSVASPLVKRLLLPVGSRDWSVQRLSTGERQRLALIRALVLKPRVLLLDEPTSGLDEAATGAVETVISERLRAGVGTLWVTHNAAQGQRIAKRCLLVEDGRVLERPL